MQSKYNGVVGQEITFDFQGEDKQGVIKEITDMGDYIVSTNDGRTVLAEEHDVIELGEMKKSTPEEPRKKRFGLFEDGGNLGGEPRQLKGYRVRVWSSDLGTSSNLLNNKKSAILVTDGRTGDSSTVMENEPYLKLVEREISGKKVIHAIPVNYGNEGKHKMFGGNFVWSTDSRFRNDVSEQPVALHDRVEFAEGGKTPTKYKIFEGYDHFNNKPLYKVTDNEDYEGEWHTNKSDAEKELNELNDSFAQGGSIEKENNQMLHNQAKEAKHHVDELHKILTSKTHIEPWVVAKMERATTDLSDVTHYLDGNKMSNGGTVDQRGDYMLLGRLQSDCDYFLGFGNGNEGRLWAGNVKDQIAEMKSIYNRLEVKPEWITMKDINKYERQMKAKMAEKGQMSKGGGIDSGRNKVYKLRAEGLNDFLAFLQKGMYMRVKSFTIKPIGIPDVEVSFETDASLSEIKSKLREVPDSHVMLETVKPINEYTGEREEDYAKGGELGSNFNPHSFTLDELNNLLRDKDIYISYFMSGWNGITPAAENKFIFTSTSSLAFKQWKDKKLTISDFGQIEVDKGSENIYLTIIVYEGESEKPYTIRIYSKENISGLKDFAKSLITKMGSGGKLTSAQKAKIEKVMHEFKEGELHSGSKTGPVVKKRDQAIAIALAEANASKKMARGGAIEINSWVQEKKGNARGQVYEIHGDFVKLKDKYGNESNTLFRISNLKLSSRPRYVEGGGVDKNIESSIITEEENAKLKQFIKHPIFKNYKEIDTFSSGGGYNHTMILLANNHVVTINWESGDVQYSYYTYKSIEEYAGEPEDDEKGWDNEFNAPELIDGFPNYSDLDDKTFLDRMMAIKKAAGGKMTGWKHKK